MNRGVIGMKPGSYPSGVDRGSLTHHTRGGRTLLSHSLRRLAGTALTALALGTAACGGDNDSTGPGAPAPADLTGTSDLTGLRTLGTWAAAAPACR